MSDGNELGKPHPALNKKFHASFIHECGYSLLDIGELEKALDCFNTLSGSSYSHVTRIHAFLDKALIFSEMMDLDKAKEHVNTALRLASETDNWDSNNLSSTAIGRRVISRKIQIYYLQNDYKKAFKSLKVLQAESSGHSSFDPELKHLEIAMFAKNGNYKDAMPLCLQSAFNATSQGYQHEALGFRIALAHLFRARNDLPSAEQILDDAQVDIYRFGCSERTYLNFLREAGRNLLAQDRFLRAYTSYFLPCFLQASNRRFERYAHPAKQLAIKCLDRLLEQRNAIGEEAWKKIIENNVKEEIKHLKKIDHVCKVFSGEDPLFGYYPAGDIEKLKEFVGKGHIEKEIKTLSGFGESS